MRAFFLGSVPDKPTTGGHLYHRYIIDSLKEMDYSVTVLSLKHFNRIFQGRILSFIFPLILFFILRPSLIFLVSDRAPRYLLISILARLIRVPQIVMVHHIKKTLKRRGFKSKLKLKSIKYMFMIADGIVVNSIDTRDSVRKLSGKMAEKKTRIINPGIEWRFIRRTKRIYQNKNQWNFISVGAVMKRKGYHFLIDALKNFAKNDFKCYIVGNIDDTEYHSFLLGKTKENGIDRNIIFTGYIADEKLMKLYENADIFILPSLHEGFGIVLCEAMCQGLPIIATNVGAVPEVITDKKTGILIEAESSDAIEAGIRYLLAAPNKLEEISKNCLMRCEQLKDWDDVKRDIRNLVKKIARI